MLEPQSRAAFSEQLSPPPGFELSHAVGTTFTLDLETALMVPLSFASHRVTAADGDLGVLDAIRRTSERIDVFAQAGMISMGGRTDLVAFLERLVHPVAVPRGLFHPKVWFLEYARGEERAYRFLCASRNLTADRSWDVLVRLDGRPASPAERSIARTRNGPLVDLLRRLPDWSIHPLADDRRERLAALGEAFRTVEWELPEGFGELSFHVLGMPKGSLPELRGKNALIISPFVSHGGLTRLRESVRADTILISRPESLDRLEPEAIDSRLQTWVLDDAATLPDDDDGPIRLNGLHAKVVIVDRREGARILLGSANATEAAMHDNVEVMVGLVGGYKTYGVRPTMAALGTLLETYPTTGGAEPSEREQAERRLERVLRRLAEARLTARVRPGDPYTLEVWADEINRSRAEGIDVRWHLLTRGDLGAPGLPPDAASPHSIEGIPLTEISPFLVLVARDGDVERRTIVLARLLDDVDTRRDAIIASRLTDPSTFVRLLLLLLELSGAELPGGADAVGFFGSATAGGADGTGLFESLVRAVGARHEGLAEVRRIVDYLQSTGDDAVLPPGFAELWSAVWTAHERLSRSADAPAAEAVS